MVGSVIEILHFFDVFCEVRKGFCPQEPGHRGEIEQMGQPCLHAAMKLTQSGVQSRGKRHNFCALFLLFGFSASRRL
ncbi:MAG: hypothetical protein CMF72_09035 [Mameliella sp.]|nr:hypothetical protein [Mameliella sp.]